MYFKKTVLYLRMIKFSHSLFALPMSLIAFYQALPQSKYYQDLLENNYYSTLFLLLKVIACMVLLRSAAMGFNRLVDYKYDLEK